MAEVKIEIGKLMLMDKMSVRFSSGAGSIGFDLDTKDTSPFDGIILKDESIRELQDFLEKSKWGNLPSKI
jgi:hypothetical protein